MKKEFLDCLYGIRFNIMKTIEYHNKLSKQDRCQCCEEFKKQLEDIDYTIQKYLDTH